MDPSSDLPIRRANRAPQCFTALTQLSIHHHRHSLLPGLSSTYTSCPSPSIQSSRHALHLPLEMNFPCPVWRSGKPRLSEALWVSRRVRPAQPSTSQAELPPLPQGECLLSSHSQMRDGRDGRHPHPASEICTATQLAKDGTFLSSQPFRGSFLSLPFLASCC